MRPILLFFLCLLVTGQLAAQPCNLQVTASIPGGQPCEGSDMVLYATANGPASYFWGGPNGYSSTYQNPVINNVSFGSNGFFIVTAIQGNCFASDTVFVQVMNRPPIFSVFDSLVCEGDTLGIAIYSGLIELPYTNVYHPDGIVFYNTGHFYIDSIATLTDAGTYKAVCISSDGCASDTLEMPVVVNPSIPTTASIIANNNNPSPGTEVTFTASVSPAGANPVVKWYKNNQLIPGATGLSYSAVAGTGIKQGDSIYALATADVMCGIPGKSNTIGVNINLSVNDISSNNISLYPNPTTGTLTIRNDIAVGKTVSITVLNVIGQLMQQMEIKASTDMQLQLSDKLPSGIYLLQVKTGDTVFIARFRLDR